MAEYKKTICVDDEELVALIRYTAHPAIKGATDGRYGPKLEPDEPAWIEIESIVIDGITESQNRAWCAEIAEYLDDEDAAAYEAHHEREHPNA